MIIYAFWTFKMVRKDPIETYVLGTYSPYNVLSLQIFIGLTQVLGRTNEFVGEQRQP